MKFTTLQEFYSAGEAYIVAARLQEHGIKSIILNDSTAGSLGVVFSGTALTIKLQVAEGDLKQAQELLKNAV